MLCCMELKEYLVYNITGYSVRKSLEIPLECCSLTACKSALYKEMAEVRIIMEWVFQNLKQPWYSADFRHHFHVHQMPVALIYIAAL